MHSQVVAAGAGLVLSHMICLPVWWVGVSADNGLGDAFTVAGGGALGSGGGVALGCRDELGACWLPDDRSSSDLPGVCDEDARGQGTVTGDKTQREREGQESRRLSRAWRRSLASATWIIPPRVMSWQHLKRTWSRGRQASGVRTL
ncbi:hypothetical protein Micbo1qcDRAFT_164151, partial [Microdochium bolleyi]